MTSSWTLEWNNHYCCRRFKVLLYYSHFHSSMDVWVSIRVHTRKRGKWCSTVCQLCLCVLRESLLFSYCSSDRVPINVQDFSVDPRKDMRQQKVVFFQFRIDKKNLSLLLFRDDRGRNSVGGSWSITLPWFPSQFISWQVTVFSQENTLFRIYRSDDSIFQKRNRVLSKTIDIFSGMYLTFIPLKLQVYNLGPWRCNCLQKFPLRLER
jgi:hypothetical protein